MEVSHDSWSLPFTVEAVPASNMNVVVTILPAYLPSSKLIVVFRGQAGDISGPGGDGKSKGNGNRR